MEENNDAVKEGGEGDGHNSSLTDRLACLPGLLRDGTAIRQKTTLIDGNTLPLWAHSPMSGLDSPERQLII